MDTDIFFVNQPFTVSQNTLLYLQNQTEQDLNNYDFVFNIEIDDVNDIFATRQFTQSSATQNTEGENTVDIDLTANVEYLVNILFAQGERNVHVYTTKSFPGTGSFQDFGNETTGTLLGHRLIEVVAHRIFGNAKARAAIVNDGDFYSTDDGKLYHQIAVGMNDAIVALKRQLFNQYIQTGRYGAQANEAAFLSDLAVVNDISKDGNDIDTTEFMNFGSSQFDIPIWVDGSIVDQDDPSDASVEAIWNGPNISSDLVPMVNGYYNIPILLQFYTRSG